MNTDQRFKDHARKVGDAVREFNLIINALASAECMAAAAEGDATTVVDPDMFSRAWAGCGPFKDQMLMCLARTVRDEWRRDVARCMESYPPAAQSEQIARSLHLRIRCLLDFGFRFLAPRQICVMVDCLVMCLEGVMTHSEIVKEVTAAVAASARNTKNLHQAVVLGTTGLYRYQPEKLLSLSAA